MTAHRRMWFWTIANVGLATFALTRNDTAGTILGVLLLAVAALTAALAMRANPSAR